MAIKEAPKKPRGRPTNYRPEYCEKLIEHMAGGLSFEAFAGAISVSVDALLDWEKAHPEFHQAKKEGLAKYRKCWEDLFLKVASGEIKGASAILIIFKMKCSFGYKDGSETGHQTDIKDNSNMIWSTNWRGKKKIHDAVETHDKQNESKDTALEATRMLDRQKDEKDITPPTT